MQSKSSDAPSPPNPRASDLDGGFPPTLWTLVQKASKGNSDESSQALRRLCEIYHVPILHYLKRRGTDPDRAQDLTQGFVEHLLERNRLEGFERGQHKFRSYLLECLKRFCRGEWRKAQADKRGGGREHVSIEATQVGQAADTDKGMDMDFAQTVHRQALVNLTSSKYADPKKRERFDQLHCFIWSNDAKTSYADAGQLLGMTSNAVKKAVFDLRQNYFDSFRRIVAQSVLPESIEEEMRYLMSLLAETSTGTLAEASS